MKILHAYASEGIESIVLETHGDVTRVSNDVRNTGKGEPINADATRLPFASNSFDFGLFHPPCQRWALPTQHPERHPDLLEETRSEAERTCKYWAIENVPYAPLNDPVILNGKHFGKAIQYPRGIESNFEIPEPEVVGYDGLKLTFSQTEAQRRWWKAKGYDEYERFPNYRKHYIVRSSLPAYVVEYVIENIPR